MSYTSGSARTAPDMSRSPIAIGSAMSRGPSSTQCSVSGVSAVGIQRPPDGAGAVVVGAGAVVVGAVVAGAAVVSGAAVTGAAVVAGAVEGAAVAGEVRRPSWPVRARPSAVTPGPLVTGEH